MGGGGLPGALHGEYVNSSGKTIRFQTGKVTAVSSTSITVVSTDNYSGTYVVSSATTINNGNSQISAITTGTTVTVSGTASGSTVTATQIVDSSTAQSQQGGGPGTGTGSTA
jgi:hypothetical protein